MPYIGVAPSSGLFKKLDAITVVNNQAAYTMQYNSSNFKPATAEQLIVSVNGVIQAPNDAYTVSGSTITFSENLVTGDVIDFIVALGEVGNTVTPVDGSVDINKMSSSLMTESGGSTTIKGALSIDSSGNVGVGTSSLNTYGGKLNITDGSVGGETTLVVANNNANQFVRVGINGDVAQIAYDNADSLAFGIATDSTTSGLTTEHMRITNSGNVLVGNSTTPSAASANAPALLVSGPNDATIQLSRENATAGGGAIQSAAGAGLVFYTHTGAVGSENYSERMRIDSSGSVQVNTTNSYGGQFTVYGNSDSVYNPMTVAQGAAGSTTRTSISFYRVAASAEVGRIRTTNTSTSYETSSDYRLKENAVDMTGAIARVKNLQPKRFNFIADDTDTLVDGFMAHEAQTVVPEAVTGTHNEVDDDGNPVYQGIDQAKLVPLLTGALQEAIAKIEALEARVDALETE